MPCAKKETAPFRVAGTVPWTIQVWLLLLNNTSRPKMAASQPSPPFQLARETSLCSAIADLSTSVTPFQDPFSGDFDFWSDSETPALPASFAGVADTILRRTVHSHPPASTWNETSTSTTPSSAALQDSKFLRAEQGANTRNVFPQLNHYARTFSEISLARTTRNGSSCNDYTAITHATHAASNSCSESDTEQLSDATSEGTRSPLKRGRTAPHSRWTTQERSLFLATAATLANTLATWQATSHSSSANDARHLAEMVASVVVTRSAREVQSHARRALRKLRARAESKSVSACIKTLLCIVGSSDRTA